MTHEHTQAGSGGPVVEWRQIEGCYERAYAGEICFGQINRHKHGLYFWASDVICKGGSARTEEAARTACEAAIQAWFRALGWPSREAQTESGGPVVEWRERASGGTAVIYGAFVGEIYVGRIDNHAGGIWWWEFLAGLSGGPCPTEPEARAACEAAIRSWFVKAGWPSAPAPSSILEHKWLDPECIGKGCQSLVWKGLYEAAVKGRQDFRESYREMREKANIFADALNEIMSLCPSTSEITLAHQMAEAAEKALRKGNSHDM